MALTTTLSTIITIVIVLLKLNWLMQYLIDMTVTMRHSHVTIDPVKIVTVFIIENIFLANEIARIIHDKQKIQD